ncbi:MAG TPA: hypothetical protein VF390_03290 [Patescibacteria group bacterium]
MIEENNFENSAQEAQTEPADFSQEEPATKNKRKISSEMVMIIIIGFLFGIAIKTEVSKRINVVDSSFYGKQSYNFAEIQKRLDEQNQAQSQAQNQAPGQVPASQVPGQDSNQAPNQAPAQ